MGAGTGNRHWGSRHWDQAMRTDDADYAMQSSNGSRIEKQTIGSGPSKYTFETDKGNKHRMSVVKAGQMDKADRQFGHQ